MEDVKRTVKKQVEKHFAPIKFCIVIHYNFIELQQMIW